VLTWLVKTGNLNVANLDSALGEELRAAQTEQSIPAGELVNILVEIDPEMELLLFLLSSTFLGAAELLHAIRQLMESLELFGDDAATKQGLLTNGDGSKLTDDHAEKELEELEAEAEADLQLAEYHLGPGSGTRGHALSLALAKLYACPANTIVHALQTILTSQEIVSLIYLLRFELTRGSWTSRYLDAGQLDSVEEEVDTSDNTIVLVSSLLNNCVDAIGAGGWLSGDARLVNGDHFESEELIASLKLEVSAALEGIEEAAYLKGLMVEIVRYGDAVQKTMPRSDVTRIDTGGPARKKMRLRPTCLPLSGQDIKILPIGLKAEHQISRLRVGAGGEVVKRSARDMGRLKSRKVGKYSLERIVL